MPAQWAYGDIIGIYKKHDPTYPKNYRPIALLDTIYKIDTRMLATRLSDAIDPYLRSSQYGFRRKRATTHAVHVARRAMDSLFYRTNIDLNMIYEYIGIDSSQI